MSFGQLLGNATIKQTYCHYREEAGATYAVDNEFISMRPILGYPRDSWLAFFIFRDSWLESVIFRDSWFGLFKFSDSWYRPLFHVTLREFRAKIRPLRLYWARKRSNQSIIKWSYHHYRYSMEFHNITYFNIKFKINLNF